MTLPYADLCRGLDAAGLSGPAYAYLRAFGVTTIAAFVDLDEPQFKAWWVCSAMRAEILRRQKAVRGGDLRIPGALARALGRLIRFPGALAVAIFYVLLTVAPIVAVAFMAGAVFRAAL